MNIKSDACETCKYWRNGMSTTGWGECYRYPPVIVPDATFPKHPKTSGNDYCGEHQER